MVSKEELRRILLEEETKERWASIKSSKRVAEVEADKKYWKKALGPFYDEAFGNPKTPAVSIDSVVKKKIKEYKANDPIFKEFAKLEYAGTLVWLSIILFYGLIGISFLIWISWYALFPYEGCLSC